MPSESQETYRKALGYVERFNKSDREGKLVPKGSHTPQVLKKAIKNLGLAIVIEQQKNGDIFIVKQRSL